MKSLAFLLLALIISSCSWQNQTEEKKAVCQAFDDLKNCASKTDAGELGICMDNAIENAQQKLQGDQLKMSYAKKAEYDANVTSYQNCVNLTVSAGSAENQINMIKDCMIRFSDQGKSILECH